MPTQIPQWLLGQDVTAVIRYQVADAAGVLSNGSSSSVTLTTVLASVDVRGRNVGSSVRAVTAARENTVVIASDDEMVITEILEDGASAGVKPKLAALRFNSEGARYASFQMGRSGNVFSFVGRIAGYSEVADGKDRIIGTMRLDQVETVDSSTGVPTANSTYS